jgi:hypothetical protein
VYFSMRDDHDNGSIIGFHQRRTSNNLGKTRIALQEFIGLEWQAAMQCPPWGSWPGKP